MKPCTIEWLTIPAPKFRETISFYENVFGFLCAEYNDVFWTFKAGNISGGFDKGLAVNGNGIGFSITVEDMRKTLETIEDHGGKCLREPYSLGSNAGYCARFSDPNGNVLELYSISL